MRYKPLLIFNFLPLNSDKNFNMKYWFQAIFAALLILSMGIAAPAFAQFGEEDVSADDTYDPFADFSEFEPNADEEADIHFFKNGRFFNFALLLGGRTWTQGLGEHMTPAPAYGLYVAYFFDIRSALQVSYLYSQHDLTVPPGDGPDGPYEGFSGTTSLSVISIDFKYYFNTSNITRGFAELNPYIIGGFSMNQRTMSITGENVLAKSDPMGVELGFGVEIPIARNKMYLGLQATYHYVSFPDENEAVRDHDQPTNVYLNGDYAQAFVVIGVNF